MTKLEVLKMLCSIFNDAVTDIKPGAENQIKYTLSGLYPQPVTGLRTSNDIPEPIFDFGIRDRIEKKVIAALPKIIDKIVEDYETLPEYDGHLRGLITSATLREILNIWVDKRKGDTSWVDELL